ncbi:hypothetical protein ACFVU2_09525 [Leifsonia sp. NPDC058194]|uniref:hypothetical protein n=1 Tax=Leifsonia sp. NPDC058194 TaxID=3346374 RepID=UPI0036DA6F34
MSPLRIVLGLIPFALFQLLATAMPVGPAALIGMAAAIAAVLLDLRGGVKAVPAAGVVILGGLALVGFLAAPPVVAFVGDYGRGLATLLLALFILGTAPFAPFTAAYARQSVAKQYWRSLRFVATNRRISLMWGLAVLAMSVGHLLASALVGSGAAFPGLVVILNWGVPIAAIVATIKYTARTATAAGSTGSAPADPTVSTRP